MCLQSQEADKSSEKELELQRCRSRAIICIQARISTAAIVFNVHLLQRAILPLNRHVSLACS